MDAKVLLCKAVECDTSGRILEAQYLYQQGIDILMKMLEGETNGPKKTTFLQRISEYLDRAEQIKARVQFQLTGGEIEKHIPIDENSSGHSYNSLFGNYLDNKVLEVLVEEPYLTQRYHFQNLVIFFELLIKKCPNLKYIKIITKNCTKNDSTQSGTLQQMQSDLKNYNITLTLVFEQTLHDRKITLNSTGRNSFIFKIGRGLHFFKPTNPLYSVGLYDYDYRKCLQTDVDILRTKNTAVIP